MERIFVYLIIIVVLLFISLIVMKLMRKDFNLEANKLLVCLGGKENIEELENCFTRLRVNVKNPDLINEDLINHVPNSGINRNGNNIQIIFGMKVAEMRDKVENAIEKEQ